MVFASRVSGCRAQCTRLVEESTDGFRAPARPRGGYEAASPAGRPLVPAAVGAAQVVAQLLSWSYLMPSYDTTLTGGVASLMYV